jgi:hypothetical protein
MASGKSSRAGLVAAASLFALGAAATALAETYKMTDERGRVHYTDRPPAELVNRGMTELNKQGMAKKTIDPALTPEQRKAEEEKAERKKQADLALVGAGILSAEARIKALHKRSDMLEREKLYYEKKPVPEKLKRELAAVAAEIPKQENLIVQKNQEALAVELKYQQQKERYRELKAQIARETVKLQ